MAESSNETKRRGALVLRTLPILLVPVVASFVTFLLLHFTTDLPLRPPPPNGDPRSPFIPIVVVVVFLSALIVLVRIGRPTISALVLIGTWTLFATLGFVRAGVTSYSPALLILPICAAGLLIDRVASISLAALAILLVSSIAWLESQGFVLPRQDGPFALGSQPSLVLAVGFWIGLFAAVAALTSLLAGGLQQALKRSSAQAEELRLFSSQLEARVQEQTAMLLEQEREAATLEERARLAREIHDTLAQGLAGITVQLGAAQRAMQAAPADAGEHMALAQQMARESLAEARRSVWNLRAPALERGDLGDALRSLAERQTSNGMLCAFVQQGTPRPLPAHAEAALLRVAQEGLANVAKHAEAQRVELALIYAPDAVELVIKDDGVGFTTDALDRPATPGPWGGFGLLGMRERLAVFGGTLTLANQNGAYLRAAIPQSLERSVS